MKKKILGLGTVLSKDELKQIKGGTVPNYCFDNEPGYRAECRELALSEFGGGGCPTWNSCFHSGPTGCIDMCMSVPGGH